MFWLLNRFKKTTEPKKRKKKGRIAILLIVGVIAFQNFAPKDSEIRMKIEDAVNSVTDLLPWFPRTFGSGGSPADTRTRDCEGPIPVTINSTGESDYSWQGGETPSNTGFAEVDPEKKEIKWFSEPPASHRITLVIRCNSVRNAMSKELKEGRIWFRDFFSSGAFLV